MVSRAKCLPVRPKPHSSPMKSGGFSQISSWSQYTFYDAEINPEAMSLFAAILGTMKKKERKSSLTNDKWATFLLAKWSWLIYYLGNDFKVLQNELACILHLWRQKAINFMHASLPCNKLFTSSSLRLSPDHHVTIIKTSGTVLPTICTTNVVWSSKTPGRAREGHYGRFLNSTFSLMTFDYLIKAHCLQCFICMYF